MPEWHHFVCVEQEQMPSVIPPRQTQRARAPPKRFLLVISSLPTSKRFWQRAAEVYKGNVARMRRCLTRAAFFEKVEQLKTGVMVQK